MSYRILRIVVVLFLLCFNGTFNILCSQSQWARFAKKEDTDANAKIWPESNKSQYLITCKGKRESLRQPDTEILRRLDETHYIIETGDTNLLHNSKVLFETNTLWKLSDRLYQKHIQGNKIRGHVNIMTTDEDSFLHELTQRGVEFGIIDRYNYIWTLFIKKPTDLDKLSMISGVRSIDRGEVTPLVESPLRDFNYNVNHINRIRNRTPSINGAGLTVSIKEQLYDIGDVDFRGRHIDSDISATEISNHSTEMATIVAGGGNSSFQGQGIAWGARLTSSNFESALPDNDSDYAGLNVSVQNHSYGTLPENFYGASARAYDQSANNIPELLHVFSAGNNGSFTPREGPYSGVESFANLTGNFKMAKNVLVVGGVDTLVAVVDDISNGPAFDGRVKPELVAYSLTGSSSSAAIVSGVALLLQQKYKEQHGVLPPSALVKALLINSADDTRPKRR